MSEETGDISWFEAYGWIQRQVVCYVPSLGVKGVITYVSQNEQSVGLIPFGDIKVAGPLWLHVDDVRPLADCKAHNIFRACLGLEPGQKHLANLAGKPGYREVILTSRVSYNETYRAYQVVFDDKKESPLDVLFLKHVHDRVYNVFDRQCTLLTSGYQPVYYSGPRSELEIPDQQTRIGINRGQFDALLTVLDIKSQKQVNPENLLMPEHCYPDK